MTVFEESCDPEALRYCAEAGDAFEDALQAALDSSLLSGGVDEAGRERLWLHPLVQQVLQRHAPPAEERLARWRRQHAEYYLEKARQYRDENMPQWRELDVDWPNIAAAADWVAALPLKKEDDARLVGNFALALKQVIFRRKLPGQAWLEAGARAFERLGEKYNQALMYNQLGLAYEDRGDYDRALEWYEKSVEIKKDIGDRAGLAATYNNIASIHYNRGDYKSALQRFEEAAKILEELGDRAELATTYNNIGEVYRACGDYDRALEWHDKARKIREEICDSAGMATTYNNIGLIYYARGDYERALEWYEKARKILEELDDRANLAATLHNMGMLAMEKKDWPAALQYFRRSRELSLAMGLDIDVAEEDELIAAVEQKLQAGK